MDDCIFCKVARKEIPASVVFENDDLLAFDDIAPQAPVHTLIIPKQHFDGLSSEVPEGLLGKLLRAVDEVARIKGIRESGYRVIVNTGAEAGQTVPHLHLHVMGGRRMLHGMVRFDDED